MKDKRAEPSRANGVAQVCAAARAARAPSVSALAGVSQPFVCFGLKGARLPGMTEISRPVLFQPGLPEGLHALPLSPPVCLKQTAPLSLTRAVVSDVTGLS